MVPEPTEAHEMSKRTKLILAGAVALVVILAGGYMAFAFLAGGGSPAPVSLSSGSGSSSSTRDRRFRRRRHVGGRPPGHVAAELQRLIRRLPRA
jgi:hypothetical protein